MGKHIGLVILLVVGLAEGVDIQRQDYNPAVRGNSFGLENFLFQTYEDVQAKEAIRNIKPKRIIPVNHRIVPERIPVYEVENPIGQFDPGRFQPIPKAPSHEYRIPIEPMLVGVQEGIGKKPREAEKEQQQQQQQQPEEGMTERVRKRIMMRRRRKRPTNATRIPENVVPQPEIAVKSVRIPVAPKLTTILVPNQEVVSQRIRPVSAKTTTTTTPIQEVVYPEREKDVEKVPTTEKPSTLNLKAFLKQQTETLSLSELLQTQNLSLADLIRGSKDASAILRAKQALTSTTQAPISSTYKRKTFNRVEPTKETPEQQPSKRMELLEVTTPNARPHYNRFQPKTPRIKVTTAKPEEVTKETGNQEALSSGSTKRTIIYNSSPEPAQRINDLRMKLRNFQRKSSTIYHPPEMSSTSTTLEEVSTGTTTTTTTTTSTTTTSPKQEEVAQKMRISFKSSNNPDLSLIVPTKTKPEEKQHERVPVWTNRLPVVKRPGNRIRTSDNLIVKPFKVLEGESENSDENNVELKKEKTTTTTTTKPEVVVEEEKKPEAKDEIIELLKSGQNADRLQRVLMSRNMTLQELLDNRESTAVQMNISELFSAGRDRERVRTTTEALVFDSLPDFEMYDAKSLKEQTGNDEQYAEESEPEVSRVQLPDREPKQFDLPVSRVTVKVKSIPELDDIKPDTPKIEDLALWKLSEKSITYGSSYGYGEVITEETIAPKITENPKFAKKERPKLTEEDIVLLESIGNAQDSNRKFMLGINDFVRETVEGPETNEIEKSYIPPAVKSAIIASGIVMGIALFVFIAIFATCGWKQRQIRLKGSSSILEGTLTKTSSSKRTLTPVGFKETNSYKKTIDFDDESTDAGSHSESGSYLWNTLKNTFKSRTNTLKSRLEKEEKLREDKMTLRRNESRRKDDRGGSAHEDRYPGKKVDTERTVINTSFNFRRTGSSSNFDNYDCSHVY